MRQGDHLPAAAAHADEVVPHREDGVAVAARVAGGIADARAEDDLAPWQRRVVTDEDVVRGEAPVVGEVVLDDEGVVRREDRGAGEVRLVEALDPLADPEVVSRDVAR